MTWWTIDWLPGWTSKPEMYLTSLGVQSTTKHLYSSGMRLGSKAFFILSVRSTRDILSSGGGGESL